MMGLGFGNMMSSNWSAVGILFWLIIFADAVLLEIWLWQKIQKGNG